MPDCKVGMVVRSKAGHDKGHCYLVLSEEGRYAYLIDGQTHTGEKAKKKNKKHLQPVNRFVDVSKMDAGAVKAYLKDIAHQDQEE